MYYAGGGTFPALPGSAPAGPAAGADISVAIYDDHVLARTGLSALLANTEIEVVRAKGIDLDAAALPLADVNIVAVAGPGAGLAEHLARDHGAPVLLMMEPGDETAALLAMLATGAAGAVCRECSTGRVVTAIRAIAGGAAAPQCAHAPKPGPRPQPLLSERERRVAAELARGLQAEDIAAELCISPHTVRTHVRNIKRKLGARTSAHAVALAIATESVMPTGYAARGAAA
jgi:DNA-binding NarL/FixJ family response regulator